MIKWARQVMLLLLMLVLIGCGFHLRGMADMPLWLNDVAIIVQSGHRDLEPSIKEQLDAYHIRVTSDLKAAHYWLIIEQDTEEEHITSVSSSTTPRQYQLTYSIKFKLQEANGKDIISSARVRSTRQITINSDRILGSNDEENTLKREMRHDAVIQLIDRLGQHLK